MNNKETNTFEQDYTEFTGCRMEYAEVTMAPEIKAERTQTYERIREINKQLSAVSDEAKALVFELDTLNSSVSTINGRVCYETGLKDGVKLASKLGI